MVWGRGGEEGVPLLAMKMCFHCEREGGERGGGKEREKERRRERIEEERRAHLSLQWKFFSLLERGR